MFAVGLVPALVAFMVRRTLDEPDIFTKRHAIKGENSFRLLVKDEGTRRITLGIIILCVIQNFGYYGIMIWMPSYLAKTLGFSLTKSGVWTAMTVLGMVCGLCAFGQLADRIGRRPVFILFQTGAAIMVFLYSRVTDPGMLLWVGAVMGLFVNGMMSGIPALISEAYPTAARATAQNVLFNIGRAVGSPGPLVVGALAAESSFNTAVALLALIFVVDIIATVFLVPELKGKELV
jgi:MFS family permease